MSFANFEELYQASIWLNSQLVIVSVVVIGLITILPKLSVRIVFSKDLILIVQGVHNMIYGNLNILFFELKLCSFRV